MERSVKHGLIWIVLAACLALVSIDSRGQKRRAQEQTHRRGSTVVDDTTRSVYGPKTTKWTTMDEIFTNQKALKFLDTTLNNYHRWTPVQHFNNFYKDLGNVGTALSPIYPVIPGTIGVSSGFTAYDQYFQTGEPRYFDTKSPYTRIFVIWGGKGRSMTRVEFSRNITPRWNFGFDYRPILVDRQIQYIKNTRQTVSQYYDFYTTYKTKDERYRVVFDYRRLRHRVYEIGGVQLLPTDGENKLFAKDALFNLGYANTEEKKTRTHVFQQFQMAKAAQLYLNSEYILQVNKFSDQTSSEPPGAFDYYRGDSLSATDKSYLQVFQNELGFKGNAGPLFYDFYYKNRAYSYFNSYWTTKDGEFVAYKKTGTERYVGGRIGLKFDSLTKLSGSAEYLLDGYYKLEANWVSPWIDAYGSSTLSKPGLMQQVYYGSHDLWNNSFKGTTTLQLKGFLKGQFGPLFVSPGASFTTVDNYLYFQESLQNVATQYQKVLPKQSGGNQTIVSPELRLTLKVLRHVYIRPQLIYTYFIKNDDQAFHIPTNFVNCQIAYEHFLFNNHLQVQTGIDAHWQSSYNALAYDPAIQQYYIQDPTKQYISKSFLLADVFFNAKIKRGKFFLKYLNLVQAFTGVGYVPTPTYPGQRSILDFGFELLLFD